MHCNKNISIPNRGHVLFLDARISFHPWLSISFSFLVSVILLSPLVYGIQYHCTASLSSLPLEACSLLLAACSLGPDSRASASGLLKPLGS
jgi:hypothetical protein